MIKKIDPVVLFSTLTIIIFMLYERYLGKVILFFNIPYIPNTRTLEASIMKYMPLLFILFIVYFIFKKFIYNQKEK